MEFEKSLGIEKIGKNRERLLFLEKEGRYVFHGSPEIIDVLEPRQAFDHNKETGEIKGPNK